MAGFLEKLFTWQYFEPVLFTTIGVLLLLLFIVLFLGKKDQKKKLEETKKLELTSLTEDNSVEAFAKEETSPEPVEVPEEQPVVVADQLPEQPAMNMSTSEEESPPIVPDFEIFGNSETNNENPVNNMAEVNDLPETNDVNNITEANDLPEVNNIPEENSLPDDIPIPDVAAPVEEMPIPEVVNPEAIPSAEPTPVVEDIPEPISVVPDVVKSSVVPEAVEKEEEAKVEISDEKIAEYKNHFADLASSISKELDEINKLQEAANESKKDDLPLPNEVNVTPINEATKFTPSSTFSSVYSPNENKKEQTEIKRDISLPEETNNENPYKMDMPIKKEDMQLPKMSKEPVNTPDFSAFNNESFDIK